MPRKIGELFFELRTTSESLKKDLAEGERQFGKFSEFVKANPVAAVTGLGLAFAGVAYQAAQASSSIDRQMRQVSNVLSATKEEAATLRQDLREISLESGRSREEMAGLFASIAKGGPGSAANVRQLAEAAIMLSDALGEDAGGIAGGLDLITDIFQIDPSRAKEVAAVLNTIASGKVPLNDVFGALQKIGPEASAIGIGFQTAAGFLVHFLDQGYSVKQVGALFKEMADRGAEGRAEIEAIGGTAINTGKSLADLAAKTEEVTLSAERQHEILKNKLHDQWLEFGNRVLPSVSAAMGFLNGVLDGNRKNLNEIEILWNAATRARRAYLGLNTPVATPRVLKPSATDATTRASEIGKRLAEIITATKNLEGLTAKALRENQKKLADIIAAPGANDSQIAKAQELQERVTSRLAAVLKKASDAEKKAEADFAKEVQSVLADISRIVNDAEQQLAEKRAAVESALTRESGAREQEISDIRAQTQALLQGAGAYDKLRIAQAADAAVRDARARKQEVNLELTADEEAAIRAQVEQLARLRRISEALQSLGGTSPFDLGGADLNVGQLADDLSAAVGAASGLAAAFGEGGRALTGLLSQTSALLAALSKVQKAGVFTDALGKTQNVGFGGALAGKAGAGGVAAAAGGALAIIGAGVAIADAVDLFGTRARERARQLREAAIAFNRALDDFAIVGRTSLEEQLRSNLRRATDLANQALKANGIGGVPDEFQSLDELEATLARFQEAVRAGAPKRFVEYVAALEQVTDAARKNAAILKAEAAREEAIGLRALEVRRLLANGSRDLADTEKLLADQIVEREEAERKFGKDSAYVKALREVQAAELAAAEATAQRARIMQQADNDDVFLGGDTAERLRRRFAGLTQMFAQFAGVFDGLDLSTREGLTKAREIITGIYKTLAEDGLDETEKAIVAWLSGIVGTIDSALAGMDGAVDPMADFMNAFAQRVELFGLSLAEQLQALTTGLAGAYDGVLDGLLANADLTTNAGRENLRSAVSKMLADILADNVVSEAEAPIFNILKTLLGIANQAIDEAAAEAAAALAEAERVQQEAAARRARARDTAKQRIDLFDLSGADALRATLDGYGEAFAGIFAQFDLTTLDGINAAQQNIRSLWESVQDMTDEQVLQLLGMTRDEFIAALLDADNGLDGLADSLLNVAENAAAAAAAARDFSEEIGVEYLRAQGRDQDADIRLAQQRRDERIAKAMELGLGPDIIGQIEAIYQKELTDIAARYATKAAESVIGAASDAVRDGAASAGGGRTNLQLVQDLGGLTEITAQSVAGLLREGVIAAQDIARNTAAMLEVMRAGLPAPPLSLLRYAAGSGVVGAIGPSGGVYVGTINVSIGAVRSDGLPLEQVGRVTVDAIVRELGYRTEQEVKFLGPNAA